jgi:hypothetical protein
VQETSSDWRQNRRKKGIGETEKQEAADPVSKCKVASGREETGARVGRGGSTSREGVNSLVLIAGKLAEESESQ